MDFSVSDKMQGILAQMTEFLEREAYPLEPRLGESGFKALLPELAERRQKVQQLGFWCPQLPKEYGGMGLTLVEHGLVSAVLGRSPLGHYLFNCQAPDAGNMEILIQHGTEEQKKTYLEPLVRGEIRSCFAMTEPGRAGSNPVWIDTTAVREGSDYILNGRKWFASSADGAEFAIVMALTEDVELPHKRASQIIVPTSTPGFQLVRNIPVMGHRGEGYASHGEVLLEDCRVPRANLLGAEGAGFRIAQERLGPGRIHHCMRWIGICERSFDLMCRRAATRELAPGQPLGTRQAVQQWIAESRAEINAARLMVLEAAWKIENEGWRAARQEISCIKFFAADVLLKVLDRAIQTHGALGLTNDTPLAGFLRSERGARIYDGPDEVHKMLVARLVLKEYGLEILT